MTIDLTPDGDVAPSGAPDGVVNIADVVLLLRISVGLDVLDEDTAAFINPEDELEVVGSGAITIVDPSEMEFTRHSDGT